MTDNSSSVNLNTVDEALKIAIIYHSNYGHTRKVAHAIEEGAQAYAQDKVEVRALDIDEMDWEFADAAQMMVFGSAVYMGSITAEFKTFMDSTSKRWFHRKWHGKWAAGFANSGGLSGDKLAALQQICLFSMQHGMNWAGFPVMPTGHSETDINRLSSFLGLMTQSTDASPEITPGEGDINTAKLFGEHLAQTLLNQPPKLHHHKD
ncbi:flavodoxin family protein [Psychrobacter sanguinis]|uniref:flavodoxin family protein n=1 Tax=Psychrobacter sanguinis TaxID=861445 RepID=UPI00020C7AE0|nr:flavodoxin family protein [Psychrobacter sanguinis]EGK11115.1 tryptophan repressor binding protein [Psychrobacter sp. 1501(2011)]MCC3307411.1 flavodoxin family protein [Psychrobacter sanguinis]MCC3344772.1 flavodoxin family protein [Psychrobacter sanguinis]MCD9152692.1 flavodoxin family protein [Psychrobacter sanguinis]MDY3306805.1 flavodoxin family protein [Psychrobacter sanguinis]